MQQKKTWAPAGFQASQTVSLELPVAQRQPSSNLSKALAEHLFWPHALVFIHFLSLSHGSFILDFFICCSHPFSHSYLFLPTCFSPAPPGPSSMSALMAVGRVTCPVSFWALKSRGLPRFSCRKLAIPSSSSHRELWQPLDRAENWDWLWNPFSYYIRILAWGNTMIAGGFNENCFGMLWLKSPSSSHRLPSVINKLVPKPGRFESISKYNSKLTWGGKAYPLETLQMCN